jgi:uncharacterized protein (DUF2252 family)
MAQFAGMGVMELWYSHISEDDLRATLGKVTTQAADKKTAKKVIKSVKGDKGSKDGKLAKKVASDAQRTAKRADKALAKAHTRDSLQALSKLAELVNGRYRIVSQPPVVVPVRDLAATYGMSADEVQHTLHEQLREYRATLPDDRRHLLERFELIDVARKVVGVGSVGTRAFIALLQGRDEHDPLFLQVKEATRSVLEEHLPHSRYHNCGERVVQGQRMMQAASDIYLGWTKAAQGDRYFYWRQLRDMKASADIEAMTAMSLGLYAGLCGWTLARGHARSGDPVAIAEYLGTDDTFDLSIADFSVRYADQNEKDYQAFADAVRAGRITATEGV